MSGIVLFLKIFMLAIPILFGLLVGAALLRNQWVKGLVRTGDGAFSPARMQLFVLSVAAALSYLATVLAEPERTAMPELPAWFTGAMLASSAVYLAAKVNRLVGFAAGLRSLAR